MQLWKSDGTEQGTIALTNANDTPGGPSPARLARGDGVLLFAATDPAHGHELWQSDGTPGGTRLVQDLIAGPADSFPDRFVVVRQGTVFVALDAYGNERLWLRTGAAVRLIGDPLPEKVR